MDGLWSAVPSRPTVSYDGVNYFDSTIPPHTVMERFPRRAVNPYTKMPSGINVVKLEPDIKLDPGDTTCDSMGPSSFAVANDAAQGGYQRTFANAAPCSFLSTQSLPASARPYNSTGLAMGFGGWSSTSSDQIPPPALSAPSPSSQGVSTASSSFDGVPPPRHTVAHRRSSAQATRARKRSKCVPEHRSPRAVAQSSKPQCLRCLKIFKNPSELEKHKFQHDKPFTCEESNCSRRDGFATINDLERHRKSVHGATPRVGDSAGYICTECPHKKFWPRKDNFKAHCERRHGHMNIERLLESSRAERSGAPVSESGYGSALSATDIVDDRTRGHEVAQANDAAAQSTSMATNDLLQIPRGDDALVGMMGAGPLCGAADDDHFLFDTTEPEGFVMMPYGAEEYPTQVEWPESTDFSPWEFYGMAIDSHF